METTKKRTYVRSPHVISALLKKGSYRTNLLPKADMVSIMEILLQKTISEVRKLAEGDDTPAFISVCAKLLMADRLNDYLDAMNICREMMEKEEKPTGM